MRIDSGGPAGPGAGAWSGVDELAAYLRGVVGPRCRDENEVDDVVQEACLRAARYRRGLADEAALFGWAARIALNVLAGRARRGAELAARGRPLSSAEHVPAEEPEDEGRRELRVGPWLIDREEALRLLGPATARLEVEERRLLSAYYGGGGGCRGAARACELPPELAKVRLFRVRRRLGRILRRLVALHAHAWVGPDGAVHPLRGARA